MEDLKHQFMRVEQDNPTYFEDNSIEKGTLMANMAMNVCHNFSKYRSTAFREAMTKNTEKSYLTDDIRRIYNGGDRFHPYL